MKVCTIVTVLLLASGIGALALRNQRGLTFDVRSWSAKDPLESPTRSPTVAAHDEDSGVAQSEILQHSSEKSPNARSLSERSNGPVWARFRIKTVAVRNEHGDGLKGILVDGNDQPLPDDVQNAYFNARRRSLRDRLKQHRKEVLARWAEAVSRNLEQKKFLNDLQSDLASYRSKDTSVAANVRAHGDGFENGFNIIQGNLTTVVRSDGTIQQYRRDGDWVYYRDNAGGVGAQFNDRIEGVQRFDYRNTIRRTQTIGENPHPGNTSRQPWSVRTTGP